MLVLSFPLIFNLVGRLDAQSRAQAGVDQVSTQVSRSEAKRDQLKARLDYVTSEAYVEWRARVEYRLTKKGEIAVVPPATQTLALPQRTWLDDAPGTGK